MGLGYRWKVGLGKGLEGLIGRGSIRGLSSGYVRFSGGLEGWIRVIRGLGGGGWVGRGWLGLVVD